MTLALLVALISPSIFTPNTPYSSPAGRRTAMVRPGATTILPNGRLLTPVGRRLYAGDDLWKILVSPDGKTLVAFCDGGLCVYSDLNAAKPVRKFIPIKELAPAGAFSADGSRLVVSEGDEGEISVWNTDDWTRDGQDIKLVKDAYAVDIAIAPNGKSIYALDVATQQLHTIDLASRTLTSSVKAGRQPYALAISKDGSRAYVANIGLFDYSSMPRGEGSNRGITRPAFGFPSKEAELGVDFEGRRVPGLGDARVPDAQSVFAYDLQGAAPKRIGSVKTGILIHAMADAGKAVGGSAPNALLLDGDRLFVSNANNDTVQIFSAKNLRLEKTVKLSPSPTVAKLRGVIPSAMAMTGGKLYVCESGLNAVAVIDPKTATVLGHVPSGWFPLSIEARDGRLYVGTQKGLGRGPQGPKTPRVPGDERAGFSAMPGMVQVAPVPTAGELPQMTKAVVANLGIRAAAPVKPAASSKIKYVVFITKENHTYDGIFGGLKGGNGEPDYAEFGMNGWIEEKGKAERLPIMPNHIRLAERFAISDNFYMEPQASGDGHRWLVGVYPSLWTTRVFYAGWDFRRTDEARGRLVSFGSNGSQIPEDYLENGSLWEHLDRGRISFRNYGEGFEFPEVDEGPAFSRTGAGEVANYPMPKALFDNTCFEFPIFNMNIPDIARVDWFKQDIEKNYRAKGKALPRFLNIALCNDHGTGARPKDGYPYKCSFMADNDLALGQVVDYLSHTPEWKNMAIFVTQDDSGGDNDHVDRHRSFVLCISPWVKPGYVASGHTSIMSILKTIYSIFGLGPNNMFDALATDLGEVFTDKPDFRPYTYTMADPRVFKPEATLDPNDPDFKKRRLRPSVRMDDPAYLEQLRNRGQ